MKENEITLNGILRTAANRLLFPDGDGGFVFPSRNREGETGCVRDGRGQRYDKNGRKLASMPTPHRLRHTALVHGS